MPTLREVGEFEVIRRVIAARPPAVTGVLIGAGDDAAVLRLDPGQELVATTDAFVEGRHWRPDLIGPRALGARLAAANLSDLAAMGAAPRWALVSAGLGPEHDLDELLALDAGLAAALAVDGAALVGGNFTAVEGPEWFALTLLGSAATGAAWSRGGARAGDLVAVTGVPGSAAAALRLLDRHGPPDAGAWWRGFATTWLAPPSRVAFALRAVAAGGVTAAIDISDGFAQDLAHLCDASGVGAEIDAASWPRDANLDRAARELGWDAPAPPPGDDYELVLAVTPEKRGSLEQAAASSATPLAFVGRFTSIREIVWRDRDGSARALARRGWDHFSG
jgi:thiamine-monophosphate kinase